MDWTDDLIARLRDLWSQGLSTAEIGRQLSITKNAVVGKAHRLGLPPRPSPIRNKNAEGGDAAPPQRKPVPSRKKKPKEETSEKKSEDVSDSAEKPKKTKSVSKKAETAGSDQPDLLQEPKVAAPKKSPADKLKIEKEKKAPEKKAAVPKEKVKKTKSEPAPEIKPIVRPKRVRDIMENPLKRGPSCQWPFGDPGTPEFHFCGAKPLPGKPYCAEHAAIAYVRIRDRREG